MRGALVVCAAVGAVGAAAAPARAQEREAPPAEAAPGSWYGWQILFSDGAAVALVAAGSMSSSSGVAIECAIGSSLAYLGGGPIVHGLHDRGVTAGESFGLRLGLPFAVGLI